MGSWDYDIPNINEGRSTTKLGDPTLDDGR